MRISLLTMVAVAVIQLGGCGGGMNSSNSDAPEASQAHEAVWITYHRDSLFNFDTTKQIPTIDSNGFAVYSSGQAIINENVTQCRICHGPTLAGFREGYKGTDCLSCHVLDPVKYPVLCYSCHGRPPVVPIQTWMSTAGRKSHLEDPDFLAFVNNVVESKKNGAPIHQEHKALPKSIRDSKTACLKCHGIPGTGSTVPPLGSGIKDPHHNNDLYDEIFAANGIFPCLYCHGLNPDGSGGYDVTPNRNCTTCHGDLTQ